MVNNTNPDYADNEIDYDPTPTVFPRVIASVAAFVAIAAFSAVMLTGCGSSDSGLGNISAGTGSTVVSLDSSDSSSSTEFTSVTKIDVDKAIEFAKAFPQAATYDDDGWSAMVSAASEIGLELDDSLRAPFDEFQEISDRSRSNEYTPALGAIVESSDVSNDGNTYTITDNVLVASASGATTDGVADSVRIALGKATDADKAKYRGTLVMTLTVSDDGTTATLSTSTPEWYYNSTTKGED